MDHLTQSELHPVLSGWKEIATHIGKGVRTVQRYEHDFSLPVRRPAGHSSGSVVAMKSELEAWVHATPVRFAFQSMPRRAARTELGELARNLQKMRELRSEMRVLRSGLQSSLATLRANIPVPERWNPGRETAS